MKKVVTVRHNKSNISKICVSTRILSPNNKNMKFKYFQTVENFNIHSSW